MKAICPLKNFLHSAIGTSRWGLGTANRVEATTYSLFSVMHGEPWLPAALGISLISSVFIRVRSMRAMRGVLSALLGVLDDVTLADLAAHPRRLQRLIPA